MGILHSEFLPQGQMTNQQVYKEIPWRLIRTQEQTRCVAEQIVAASVHCACSERLAHPSVSVQEKNCREGATTLSTWSCSVWFSFPHAQGDNQGVPFWRCIGHQEVGNDGAECIQEESLLRCLRSVVKKDRKSVLGWTGIIWRGNHVVCSLQLECILIAPPLLYRGTSYMN